jgi:hypothetical protein
LALATWRLDLLHDFDAIAFVAEPVDSLRRYVSIDNYAAAGLTSSHDDNPKLAPKFGQMSAIPSGDEYVECGHEAASGS